LSPFCSSFSARIGTKKRHSFQCLVLVLASSTTFTQTNQEISLQIAFDYNNRITMKLLLMVVSVALTGVGAFVPHPPTFAACRSSTTIHTSSLSSSTTTPSTATDQVIVLEDATAVSAKIRDIVQEAAEIAIAKRGHFALAIPGGSILKMLVGSGGDWTSKTTLAYVNHKCVNMEDAELATHAKAMNLFLGDWEGCNCILMDGTDNGVGEAESYEAKLKALSEDILPRNDMGLPVFDLALIGVGDDGHVGSLYPNREEVLEEEKWVLPVAMKDPPSISLTLPVMAGARQSVVAACGVSDKYPQGKSAGMYRAVVAEEETLQSFPAVGLRSTATWIMDKAAASKLGDAYLSK
jgi:6-phosphogluconolactonase